MDFVVKFFWIAQRHFKLHCRFVSDSHEIVIPRSLSWHHEEAQESITKKHLNFFVVTWQITFGIVSFVRIVFAPLKSTWSQLVCRQGT